MPGIRAVGATLRFATNAISQERPYMCYACRMNSSRMLHSSSPALVEKPFVQQLRERLMGENKSTKVAREAKSSNRQEEVGPLTEKSIRIDGDDYVIAPVIDTSVNTAYKPSSTWKGLNRVGGLDWIRQQSDKEVPYIGFASTGSQTLSKEQWLALVTFTALEIQCLSKAGRDLGQICHPRLSSPPAILANEHFSFRRISSGQSALDPGTEQQILNTISPVPSESHDPQQLAQELHRILNGVYQLPSLEEDFPLHDVTVKLTVHKRMLQLTGKRLPDVVLMQARSIGQLVSALGQKPLPKKLAHDSEFQQMGQATSNIKIYTRRHDLKQREKEIGRWKLIEQEMIKRDLALNMKSKNLTYAGT